MIYECLDNLILFLWNNMHLWIMLNKTQVNLVFIVTLVISVLLTMMMMMVNTYCTEEEDHAAERKTTGITKVTWKCKYSKASQYGIAVLLSIDMLQTCIQAWIPATINAWAKKSAVSYHSSQELICADRADQTQILTRSTWFNYSKNIKTRKTELCAVKTDCCCQINMLYWFSLLLHMRTERAFKVLELMLCNMNGPFNWVKRTRKPTFMRWRERWDDWSRNDRLTQLFH